MKNYKELLNKTYQKEMIRDIGQDLKKYYPNMEEKEVIILSNQIYVFCTLHYHKVDLLTILKMIYFVGNYYVENKIGKNKILETAITNDTSISLQLILNKYINETEKKNSK